MMTRARSLWLAAAAASLALSACAGGGGGSGAALPAPKEPARHKRSGSNPIQHVVLMIQENRSFNNLFATYPGVVGTTTGEELVQQGSTYVEEPIPLTKSNLEVSKNIVHLYSAFLTAWQNGNMDGFDLIPYAQQGGGEPEGSAPYQYVNPNQIEPYWRIAKHWGLADEMFQTQGSDSFTAHQDLIRGGTCISPAAVCANPSASPGPESLIDPPTSPYVWGCDSGPGTTTSFITPNLEYHRAQGPFPCSNKFGDYGSSGYRTLRDLFDTNALSWKYYTPMFKKKRPSALWDAFDVIAPVRYGPEWTANISSPETNIFSDITKGTLPTMSWVIPDAQNSDHPGYSAKDTGPSWVASIVNAIGKSQYWDSTVIIIVWDDWGGFYDPVPPPFQDGQGGAGFRVPMLVVSPYVTIGQGPDGGYVSNTVYQFGSIIRFIEDTWNLGRLGTTDVTCTSIADMFDFTASPRPFTPIRSTYDEKFFLHQKPSELPVDTQ